MQASSTTPAIWRWLLRPTLSRIAGDGRRQLYLFVLIGLISLASLQTPSLAVGENAYKQEAVESELQRAEDTKLVDGLRRRRLFDLAKLHCQSRLSQASIDPTSEAHLTIELMKTQTAMAILTVATERPTAWQSVDETATRFSTAAPDHPRRLLVEVQRALSHLTHAKMIRQEIAAEMATDSADQEALNEIRTARSLLERLGSDIDKAITELRGRSKVQHDLTAEQLLNLKNNLRFQLAKCNLIRSQLYEPSDRLNRVAALGEVKQQLGEVQRVTSKGQPLWWNTQLGQLECLRLLGDSGAAKLLVDSLPNREVPGATVLPLLEQKVRLAIEMGNEVFSQQVFEAYLKLPASNPQLDLALVELSADLSARASSDELKKQWLDYASGFARKIEMDHGGYWGRRADLVLIRSAGGDSVVPVTPDPAKTPDSGAVRMDITGAGSSAELDQLIRLAENAFRKNNLDDSIKAYQQAVVKARELGDSNQALQLGMIIGQILEKQAKPEIAADQFIKSALADVKATNASSAHLRGCWNLSTFISSAAGQTEQDLAERLTGYRVELSRHLELWPEQPSADHARLYLADRNRRDRQWKTAFENYLGVRVESPHFSIAVEGLGTTSRQLVAQAKRNQQSALNLSSDLILSLTKKRSEIAPANSSFVRVELLIAELEMLFGGGASDQAIADKIVKRLEGIGNEQATSNLPAASSARAIQASAICDNDPETAEALVIQLGEDKDSLVLCESCLEAIVISRGSKQTLAQNRLRLLVIENLLNTLAKDPVAQKQVRSSSITTNWMLKKSEVLSSLGRHAESVAVLEKLKAEFPRNAGIQMQLARSLTAQFQTNEPQKPLDHWRRLLRKLKSYTPNWYEAKYNIAFLLHETGKTAETVKLLKLLRDVGRGWENAKLKPEFESLLQSASRSK